MGEGFDISSIDWSEISNLMQGLTSNKDALNNTGAFSLTPNFGLNFGAGSSNTAATNTTGVGNGMGNGLNNTNGLNGLISSGNDTMDTAIDTLVPELYDPLNMGKDIKLGIAGYNDYQNNPKGSIGAIKRDMKGLNPLMPKKKMKEKIDKILKENGHVLGFQNGMFEGNSSINSFEDGGAMDVMDATAQSIVNYGRKHSTKGFGWSTDPDMVI